uniref:Uncharacterized protein n=1 Tax=Leersia perrieri TaxID=77586 RepID=A0A0D9WXQ3_9ORYZ
MGSGYIPFENAASFRNLQLIDGSGKGSKSDTQTKNMLQVQGSLRIHTFSSAAIVHAVETSDDDSDHPSHFAVVPHNSKKASRGKQVKKGIKKLLSSLRQKHHISNNEAVDIRGGAQSDMETFVSAKSSELRSFCTDDESELQSFRLSPLIFPTGGIEFHPPASPLKIIKKLPFGYVIGRQVDAPATTTSMKLSLSFKNLVPKLVKSKSKMVKNRVFRALKERFGRSRKQGSDGDGRVGEGKEFSDDGDGDGDDEDVFWRKDVRGLRCRRVDDNDLPY